jgi:hypothetical protein
MLLKVKGMTIPGELVMAVELDSIQFSSSLSSYQSFCNEGQNFLPTPSCYVVASSLSIPVPLPSSTVLD